MSKQYGLILSDKKEKKPTPIFQATRNVFGDDSDSDKETNQKKPLLRPSDNTKRQTKVIQQKALTEDPTVYQYDELYDDMVHQKKVEKTASKEEKKPRYIEKLLESANKRKREHERRLERQVQKEREKEGDEFADKESFVTSAYKKKLEELRAEEEKEKREEYLEKIGDVTKQKDLGGFYRHLYEQKLGAEPKLKEETKTPKKEESEQVDDNEPVKSQDKKEKTDDESAQRERMTSEEPSASPPLPKQSRNYRKRKNSSEIAGRELSEGEIDSEEEINVPSLEDIRAGKKSRQEINIDADSDFSIDSSEGEEDDKSDKLVKKKHKNSESKDMDTKKEGIPKDKEQLRSKEATPITESTSQQKEHSKTTEDEGAKTPPKPKINIWEKRTVGVVFEEALKRYYERKAARSQ